MLVGSAVLAFAVCFISLRVLLLRFSAIALDRPNERSLHEVAVPRIGGLAIMTGVLLAALSLGGASLWLTLALAAVLCGISTIDDLRGLPVWQRLAVHAFAAVLVAWYVLSPMHPAELALAALALVWVVNLYNFMDGSDGLAGGMTVCGFAAYAVAAFLGDDAAVATLASAVAGASAAFLIHNFHPARVFLGDAGSISLGFLAGALGIVGWRDDVWPWWFPCVVFAPFIADATVTLARRAWRRERLWQAHRDHYYQRLVRLGFGHRGTAYIEYALMLLCAAAALYARDERPLVQWTTVGAVLALMAAFAAWVELQWRRRT